MLTSYLNLPVLLLCLLGTRLPPFAGGTSPGANQDCKLRVLEAYRHLVVEEAQATDKPILHIIFTTTTEYIVPGTQAVKQDASTSELFARKGSFYFKSPKVTIWQDNRYVAAVYHPQRSVLLTRVSARQLEGPQNLVVVRDSLLSRAHVLECREETSGKKPMQFVRLALEGKISRHYRVSSLDFWLQRKSGRIAKMRLNYQAGQPVERVTMNFLTQEHLTSSPSLTTDVRGQVLASPGHLRSTYQGYQLVDQTKGR